MKEYVGHLNGKGVRIAIVVSRFNEMITKCLLHAAIDGLRRHEVLDEHISVAWVPGAFEIPFIARKFATSKEIDAVICLGAIIRGATPHFDFIAGQCISGIATAAQESNIPVILGILTTNTIEEALERAGTKVGNKGFDSALAALEMANIQKQFKFNASFA